MLTNPFLRKNTTVQFYFLIVQYFSEEGMMMEILCNGSKEGNICNLLSPFLFSLSQSLFKCQASSSHLQATTLDYVHAQITSCFFYLVEVARNRGILYLVEVAENRVILYLVEVAGNKAILHLVDVAWNGAILYFVEVARNRAILYLVEVAGNRVILYLIEVAGNRAILASCQWNCLMQSGYWIAQLLARFLGHIC